MGLKSNFTDASGISSPFVDEVANPGDDFFGTKAKADALKSAQGGLTDAEKLERVDRNTSKAQRDARDQALSQAPVQDEADQKALDKARGL